MYTCIDLAQEEYRATYIDHWNITWTHDAKSHREAFSSELECRHRCRRRCHSRRRAVIFHSLASNLVCAIVVLDEQLSQFHSAPRTATRTWRANLAQVN